MKGASENRSLPLAMPHASADVSTDARVWVADDGASCLSFSISGMGPDATVWTTRDGLVTLRDAINAALVHTDV